ncbi:MAG: class I SAM-dependent methyltransferase [Planctomycetota bacterium]|jgi:predicted O-methyltransferase YrrM
MAKSNVGKGLEALAFCVRYPSLTVRSLGRGLAGLYREKVVRASPIPAATLDALVARETSVTVSDFEGRDGNVSLYELLAICAIVRHRQPQVVLEIGTFDGNTTLQMAQNSPDGARIYTLDLPPKGEAATTLDPHDRPYIDDMAKVVRRYERSPLARKVVQCLGDSATFDFGSLPHPDVAFIDGSHSYDYVKNDTEKVLDVLAPGGVVLWHDYRPAWPGVLRYLDERSRDLALVRIEGTSLVCLDTARGR